MLVCIFSIKKSQKTAPAIFNCKGEILALRWKDCDLKQGYISVQKTLTRLDGKLAFQEPKTRGSKRIITLPEYVYLALKNID